jgi:S-adenosylmethionine hydrolase
VRKAAQSRLFPITILTDFGYRDHYVGVMKGVITKIAPGAHLIDLTHGLAAQQVPGGAIALVQSWRFFPKKTVFLAVVDPGVGTARRPIAIATRAGAYFVGPDNGLLWPAANAAGIKSIVELKNPRYRLPDTSDTFHGRDIFAPAAAWIARGTPVTRFGPKLDRIVQIAPWSEVSETPASLNGRVIYVDTFGNLITNLTRSSVEQFAKRRSEGRLAVQVEDAEPILLRKAYGDVAPGEPVALYGSFGTVEIAIRDGDAAALLGAAVGFEVWVGWI